MWRKRNLSEWKWHAIRSYVIYTVYNVILGKWNSSNSIHTARANQMCNFIICSICTWKPNISGTVLMLIVAIWAGMLFCIYITQFVYALTHFLKLAPTLIIEFHTYRKLASLGCRSLFFNWEEFFLCNFFLERVHFGLLFYNSTRIIWITMLHR